MEKVGIEINLIGADKAAKTLEAIESTTRRLGAKRTMIQMEDGSLKSVDDRIKEIQDRLAVLRSQKKLKLLDANQKREMERLNAELTVLNRGLKNGTANAKTFKQVFNSISSAVAHAGSAMQSMGNALTRLGSFMRPITTGLLMGAGYNALNLITEGFGNAFERADTMRNYDRQLKALGLDVSKTFSIAGKEAKTAKENLDDAVQGLPTSLDEIMAAQKVYAGATGEMVNSTKTAIAANNSFLASGMGAREQRFMQKYLVALSSGAELTTTQWQSMERIAPLVMRSVAKELGYAGDAYSDFRDDVEHGRIAGEDFLKAFQKVGISGAVADAARAQTESWNGLFSNIRIAVTRMGANVLDTLNQTFKDATGRTLLQRLLGWDSEGKEVGDGIKHWINDMSESVQNWIKANPGKILEFFNTLKGIDFKGLFKGMAEGMGDLLGILEALAKIASNRDMSKVGRFLSKAGVYGRLFTIVGGIIKGMRHPIAAIGAGGAWLFKGKVGGFFGKIAQIFGKKKDVEMAGEIGTAVSTASPKLLSAFKNMALLSGIVAMPAVTAWGVTAAVKQSVKNFKDTIELFRDMDWNAAAKLAGGIATFLGASAGLGALVGKFGMKAGTFAIIGETVVGLITSIATGFFDLDMAFIKGGMKNFKDALKYTSEALAELDGIKTVFNVDAITRKFQNVRDTFNAISSVFAGKDGSIKDRGVVEQGMPTFRAGQANSVKNLSSILANIQKIIGELNKIAVMTVKDPTEVLADIKSACDQLQGIRGPKNIEKHTEKVADALIQIRRMAYHINKLAGTSVDTGGFSAFIEQMRTALEDLKSLSQTLELDIKVVLGDGFKSSVNGVVKQINEGKEDIKRAVRKIPSAITKHISVTITASVNTKQAADAIENGADYIKSLVPGATSTTYGGHIVRANGGLIYRAKGGSIFKPKGTDTVPAMLTPGEYVHNRRAVNTFGIDFMRKVNNLDMKGAMNELMHRAGHMANINRGMNITNNNYNNQKVVINNSNAGAGYTFKTASRFVGAF